MVPWSLITTNPSYAVLVPFVWILWQIYLPRFINRLVGRDPSDGFVYDTWFSSVKHEFKSEFDRIDNRVDSMGKSIEYIADKQEQLVSVTIAQSHMLNGYDGDIDVEDVEENLRDNDRPQSPEDYLEDDL